MTRKLASTAPWTQARLPALVLFVSTCAAGFWMAAAWGDEPAAPAAAAPSPSVEAAPTAPAAASPGGSRKLEYNRDIRPILSENCFRCHGPDSAARKADLRLDKREVALSTEAIVPGEPDASSLIERIFTKDPEALMPPPDSHKKLSDAQKEILKRWIAEGAEYQSHWSYIAPTRPALPTVKNSAWVRNPIDAFILAGLEAKGLAPAPEADRRVLARRLSLDLTGVPPRPDLVEGFVHDSSDNAYENLVDKLLAMPQWGEHRGRYWLDAARYADTHGIHFDNFREMWTYRDWVIDAFNRNLPFDQFTIEQLAGDLLPNRTLDQQIASGFNRCNITTNEGGAIDEEYLVLYARDRTETVSLVWLGTTAGCATCHDHKFDPLSQREFYELTAFFNNTTQAAMDGNIKDTPPIVPVPLPADRERFASLEKEIPAAREAVEVRRRETRPAFDAWLATAKPEEFGQVLPADAPYLSLPLSEGQGKKIKLVANGQEREAALADSATWAAGPAGTQAVQLQGAALELSDVGDFDRDQPWTVAAWIRLPANDASGAVAARMDNGSAYRGWDVWMQGRRIGTHLVNAWPDNGLKVVGEAQIPGNEWTHVAVSYDGGSKAAGVKVYYNGVPQKTLVENDRLSDTIKTSVPFKLGQRNTSEPISAAGLQGFRLYKRVLTPGEVEALAKNTRFADIVRKAPEARTDGEKNDLFGWWLTNRDSEHQNRVGNLSKLEQEMAAIRARGTIAHVQQEKTEPAMAFILFRGDYDKRRDKVEPKTPAFLPPMPAEFPRNRLGFARWLLSPEHPLTARVTVNRFWQELFGTGLVRTSGDLGMMGELPSHPELLDWLAVEFRESGWDVKKLFKLIVMSNTYRQASVATPQKLELDPLNRLLSRGPRFRMDAEMVRDYALAASGLLAPKIGGPSVKPYQPDGVWEAVAMIGSNTRDYKRDSGENLYRRSMYTLWKRAAPPASMDIFNAPAREVCAVRRERTNTPLQALVTLNDPQFVEAARVLAQQALRQVPDLAGRFDFLARRLLARPFTSEETAVVQASYEALADHYRAHPDQAQELLKVGEAQADPAIEPSALAAWTMLVNQLMNLDEVLNK